MNKCTQNILGPIVRSQKMSAIIIIITTTIITTLITTKVLKEKAEMLSDLSKSQSKQVTEPGQKSLFILTPDD